jgi:hypothetical protein
VHEAITEEYCKQLTSEARVVIEGKPVWVKRSRHNHYLDCETLCAAIGYTMNVQRIPEGVVRAPKREAAVPGGHDGTQVEGEDPDTPPPTSQALRDRGGGGALRARFARHGSRLNK